MATKSATRRDDVGPEWINSMAEAALASMVESAWAQFERVSGKRLDQHVVQAKPMNLILALEQALEDVGIIHCFAENPSQRKGQLSKLATALLSRLDISGNLRGSKPGKGRRANVRALAKAVIAAARTRRIVATDYLTVTEVAAAAGAKLNKDQKPMADRSIRRWIAEGRIKAYKIGDGTNPVAEWRIAKDELARVLDKGTDRPGTHKNTEVLK